MSAGGNFNHSFDLGHCRYTDERSGLTQFHEVCMSGPVATVERFLELGQDPNCLGQIAAGLIHCRLPILCGDVICDNLNNEDLFNICLAVEGQGRARDAERND
ncbi:hypothetical protein TKK_0018021 [Trichogramma kaykai]|uniref:Uncharacterized protein n=1 Tax=Trichogramma kaykai TaxID=54128 RepID=A0ABD2W0K9_9HYME